jgi:DNA-binding HxlR family transcriptional regulator
MANAMSSGRIYRHFCMMARTLELIGERWSLLIVRDLLFGPRRFTDLARALNDITPSRLTSRLRRLEAAGIVTREPSSTGREVWYALTEAGAALEPIVDGLTLWGIENAPEPPLPGEPAQPEPVMIGTKVVLKNFAPPPETAVSWVWCFAPDDSFTIVFDEGEWKISRGEAEAADVIVDADAKAWAHFLTSSPRHLPQTEIQLTGLPTAQARFARAFYAELRRSTG